MPLRPPQQPLISSADWDRWAREVLVVPDANSVGEGQLKDNSIAESKYGDASVSTRAMHDEAVTNAKLRKSNGLSVMGQPANAVAAPVDISAAANGTYLRRKADILEFAAIEDTDLPASIARDSEVVAAISTHEAATDPHPQYLTQTEGDGRYRQSSAAVPWTDLSGVPAALGLIHSGTGSPEAVLTAGIGSLYLRTDGGAGTTLYVKESGAGNTGWIGK